MTERTVKDHFFISTQLFYEIAQICVGEANFYRFKAALGILVKIQIQMNKTAVFPG